MAEKYVGISSYAYVANNPLRFIDPDGKKIVDANEHVMYTQKGGWNKYATADAKRLGTAMMQTRTGIGQWNNMVNAAHPITLTISPDDKTTATANGKSYLLGITHNSLYVNSKTGKATTTKSDIIIYEGTINTFMNDTKNSKNASVLSYQNNTINTEERIGAVGGHESFHATNQNNIQQSADNKLKGATNDVEASPVQVELKILDEIGMQNMQPIEPKKLESIPISPPILR